MAIAVKYKVEHVKSAQGGVGVEPSKIQEVLNIRGKEGWNLFSLIEHKVQQVVHHGGINPDYHNDILSAVTLVFTMPAGA